MKVLAIGAHHDDIEMGCGGTLALHAGKGDEVTTLVVTASGFSGSDGSVVREDETALTEAEDAARILGVNKTINLDFPVNNISYDELLVLALRKIVDDYSPDYVYTHWDGDVHLDHRNVALASFSACRHVPTLLVYASNWYVGPRAFHPVYYVDISEVYERKMNAIAAYRTEWFRRGATWKKFMDCQCGMYGLKRGTAWAEGYEVVKMAG